MFESFLKRVDPKDLAIQSTGNNSFQTSNDVLKKFSNEPSRLP